MANIGTLANLATNQAYLDNQQVNSNFTVGGSNFTVVTTSGTSSLNANGALEKTGYSGQLIKSATSNDYFLLDRGTVPTMWSNLAADLNIGLGTFGGGASTDQIASAKAYASAEFTRLAQKMADGTTTIDTLYLAGHSSGYAQAIMQYEELLRLSQDSSNGYHNQYVALLSKVQIFGDNGAGTPN